jgi:hypothetical protein
VKNEECGKGLRGEKNFMGWWTENGIRKSEDYKR